MCRGGGAGCPGAPASSAPALRAGASRPGLRRDRFSSGSRSVEFRAEIGRVARFRRVEGEISRPRPRRGRCCSGPVADDAPDGCHRAVGELPVQGVRGHAEPRRPGSWDPPRRRGVVRRPSPELPSARGLSARTYLCNSNGGFSRTTDAHPQPSGRSLRSCDEPPSPIGAAAIRSMAAAGRPRGRDPWRPTSSFATIPGGAARPMEPARPTSSLSPARPEAEGRRLRGRRTDGAGPAVSRLTGSAPNRSRAGTEPISVRN